MVRSSRMGAPDGKTLGGNFAATRHVLPLCFRREPTAIPYAEGEGGRPGHRVDRVVLAGGGSARPVCAFVGHVRERGPGTLGAHAGIAV
jgi:hypothetical protein